MKKKLVTLFASAAVLAIGVKNRMTKYNSYGYLDELESVDEISDYDIRDYEINVGLKDESEALEEPTEEEEKEGHHRNITSAATTAANTVVMAHR